MNPPYRHIVPTTFASVSSQGYRIGCGNDYDIDVLSQMVTHAIPTTVDH
jgi:hypothetical protein